MRSFLAAVLMMFAVSAFAFDRAERLEMLTKAVGEEAGKQGVKVTVEDTGKDFDGGFGEGPVAVVTVVGSHFCLVAIHPVEDTMAILGCEPVPAEEKKLGI